ncbi:MAG TPA: hypothetical protein VK558_07625 [Patescibacteria group bacterium]|nr:hypothetical protein [Patescibacteria group bacterium]
METAIDLTPLLGLANQALIASLAAIGTWAAAWVKRKTNIEANGLLSSQIDGVVERAIGFAQAHLMTLLGHADFAKVETRSTAVQIALGFVASQASSQIASLGLTEQHLADLVLARMAKIDPTLVLPGSVALPAPAPVVAPVPLAPLTT